MIKACDCTVAGRITAKSAAASKDKKPSMEVPFGTKSNGAAFQDKLYGKGQRLHNRAGKKSELVRCSVCTKTTLHV